MTIIFHDYFPGQQKLTYYHSGSKIVPLIVAGPPRSGTRFVTNVLNKVPGVTINGEIPDPIMNSVVRLVKKCDRMYRSNQDESWALNWDLTKRDYMFAVWATLNKSRILKADPECVFFGYKTPFHEKYFDFYNAFFHPVQPRYVCCVRSFPDHLLSVQARWPGRVLPYVAFRYVMSLRRLRSMKEKKPDQVLLFFLDDYKKIGNRYLSEKIFKPLGLEDVTSAIQKAEQGPVNTSEQLGCQRKFRLSKNQEQLLRIYPRPLNEFNTLRHDFS